VVNDEPSDSNDGPERIVGRPLATADHAEWLEGAVQRFATAWLMVGGVTGEGASALGRDFVGRVFDGEALRNDHHLFALGGAVAGTCWMAVESPGGVRRASVVDVAVVTTDDATGPELRRGLWDLARGLGASQLLVLAPGSGGSAEMLVRAGPSRLVATHMVRALFATKPPARRGPGVSLRQMEDVEYATFLDQLMQSYGEDTAVANDVPKEESMRAGRAQIESLLTDGVATEGHHLLTARNESGQPVGALWLHTTTGPGGPFAFVYDVVVDTSVRGRGFGRSVMVAAEELARSLGARYIELNVFGFNDVARSLYRSIGYSTLYEFVALTTE
jgi:ribosomal protein S18 acetylase RimI-like enzyme